MKKVIVFTIVLITVIFIPASATIINIPDDYVHIQEGIDASSDSDTVLVQPGTYVECINFNGHNIIVGSLFLTTGDTSYISTTIIDGDLSGTVITFENGEDSTAIITGFTIQNGYAPNGGGIYCTSSSPTISDNIIRNNSVVNYGGGINCSSSNSLISFNVIKGNSACIGGGIACQDSSNTKIINNFISDNNADESGGIDCEASNATIHNNIINENSASEFGGGISCFYECYPLLTNNTISGNISREIGGGIACSGGCYPELNNNTISGNDAFESGGGIFCTYDANPNVVNTILWNNSPQEVCFDDNDEPNSITISYSDLEGGEEGIETNGNGEVIWLEGNIDADPFFRDPENGDFYLTWVNFPVEDSTKSPCIDSGDPSSPHDPDGTRADMGALPFDQTVGIDDLAELIPSRFSISQNYPNPFNPTTTIQYNLPHSSDVRLDIYDILGRKVETLLSKKQPAGSHSVIWDARDLPTGIYFYKIQTGDYSQSRKCILLK